MHYQMTSIGEMAKLYQKRCLIDSNEVNCNFRNVQNYRGLRIALFTGELNPRLGLCVSLNNLTTSFSLSQPT